MLKMKCPVSPPGWLRGIALASPPHHRPLHHQRIPLPLVRSAHVPPRVCERLCGSAGASSATGAQAQPACRCLNAPLPPGVAAAAASRIHAAAPEGGGAGAGGQLGFWRWSLGPLLSLSPSRGISLNLVGSVVDSDIASSVAQIIWAPSGLCLFNTR